MAKIQVQDNLAIEALYRRHGQQLRTIIGRILNDFAETDDVLQEVFLDIWEQAFRYQEEKGKVTSWIVTVARRRAIDRLRKKMTYDRAKNRFQLEIRSFAPLRARNASEIVSSDAAKLLADVIAHLPQAQQEVLHFVFFRGMSHREMAAHTGIPLGTIKTRIELAIRKLRASLAAKSEKDAWLSTSLREHDRWTA